MSRVLSRLAAVALLAASPLAGCVDMGALGPLTDIPGNINAGGGGFSIITNADPSVRTVSAGQSVRLSVTPSGASGTVTYAWSASDGTLSATTGSSVTWTAPESPGDVTVQVTASAGGQEAPGAYRFTVE